MQGCLHTNQMVVVVMSRPTEMNLTDSEGIYSRNIQNFFARCARERVVGAASRPTGRPLERRPDRPAAGAFIYNTLAYLLINPAAGSTLFPADPFVITRIQIACVDENGPVVVMSGVLRFEIFRMTRSITHVIKFSMKQTSGRLGTQLIRSGVVEL